MTQTTHVLYNASCPICSREIDHYRKEAENCTLPVSFADLHDSDLDALGLSEEDALRRLHVVQDGRVLVGVDAFLALWAALPRWAWLARIVGSASIRPLARLLYERVAAPLLYALHRRRKARLAQAR